MPRPGLALLSEKLNRPRVFRHDYGEVTADPLPLIEKPGFAEVGIGDMNEQGVLLSDDGLDLGRDVHTVRPDDDQHHVLIEVDGRLLEQGILAGRGGVGL